MKAARIKAARIKAARIKAARIKAALISWAHATDPAVLCAETHLALHVVAVLLRTYAHSTYM